MKFSHLDLFSGIGGFSLAVDRVWPGTGHIFVEKNDWCHQWALRPHWPKGEFHYEVEEFKRTERIDILTAGPPCQPASIAGKRKGAKDSRWLWPETLRVLRKTRPVFALFENPTGILSLEDGLVFELLLSEMEDEGYEVQAFIIPACAVGAAHRRDRVWIIAYNSQYIIREISKSNKRRTDLHLNGNAVNYNGKHCDNAGFDTSKIRREQRQETEVCKCNASDNKESGRQGDDTKGCAFPKRCTSEQNTEYFG